MAELYRFAAFISYSSKDAPFARRLHRALESYGIPTSLGKFDLIGGGKRNRIYPVFRDREELSAGHLSDQIEANLKASAALIVVCSPDGAASPWVQKEIEFFAALRKDKIFAIIPDSAPLVDSAGADCTRALFPPAFCGDALQGNSLEPLAADARKGRDGFRNAWLKVVAGMIGVSPGQIIDRDKKKQHAQRLASALTSVGILGAAVVLANVVDERNARGDLTARAMQMTSEGQTLQASPFALAAMPAAGDVIRLTHSDSLAALERSGVALAVERDLGIVDDSAFAGGSRFLATTIVGSFGELRDLTNPAAAPLPLGRVSHFEVSGNGRFLATQDLDAAGTLVDLQNLTRPQISLGLVRGNAFSGDSRFLATHGMFDTIVTLRDLRNLATAPQSLGRAYAVYFSDDGGFLFLHARSGAGFLYDLREPSATPRSLGRVADAKFSHDGRFLAIAQSPDYAGVLFNLSDPSAPPRHLGPITNFLFSGDSRFLVTQAVGGSGLLFDLRGPPAAPLPLGRLQPINGEPFGFSNNGRYLITRDHDHVGALRDMRDIASAPRTLRRIHTFSFSNDNRFLAVSIEEGTGELHDLDNLAAAPLPLGRVSHVEFSGDSQYLVTQNAQGAGLLRNLRNSSAAPLPLGQLLPSPYFIFSPDGRFLLTRDEVGVTTLRDLREIDSRLMSAEQICLASGDQVRPIPSGVRSNSEDNLYSRLRGRPANPCDWRGLLAVFPNAELGDGWFEGMRQWLRLMRVRYFGGKDWTCEETTSAASAETRARRREMCNLAARVDVTMPD